MTLFVLAAGAVVLGLLLQASSASSDAASIRAGIPSNACTHASNATCTALSNDVDSQHRDALLGGALLGGAGALVLAGAATLLLWPSHAETTAWLAPAVVPGGGSLTVLGAF